VDLERHLHVLNPKAHGPEKTGSIRGGDLRLTAGKFTQITADVVARPSVLGSQHHLTGNERGRRPIITIDIHPRQGIRRDFVCSRDIRADRGYKHPGLDIVHGLNRGAGGCTKQHHIGIRHRERAIINDLRDRSEFTKARLKDLLFGGDIA
jgi:hypothetical protein